jgi:hypothetical protein
MGERTTIVVKRDPVHLVPILLGNMVPIVGCIFLQWSLLEAFLFYAAELCAYELVTLPKIVLFTFDSSEYALDSAVKKTLIALCWIVFHLGLFSLTLMFLVQSAYATGASSAKIDIGATVTFASANVLALVILATDYAVMGVVEFRNALVGGEAYYQRFLMEMSLLYLIILTVLGIVNGFANLVRPGIRDYQLVMLVLVVILKSGAQILGVGKRRNRTASV